MMVSLRKFKMRLRTISSSSILLLFALRQDAGALSIDANLTNLADTVAGQDLWNASFTLSSGVFQVDQGFTIYFDHLDYSDISAPLAPIPPGWDVLSIQPDPLLSAPGFLDGLALVNNPTLLQPFSVNFVWHGAGDPGTQPFETYSLAGGFAVTGSGQTTTGMIPEIGFGFGTGWALAAVAAFSALRRPSGFRRKMV